MIGSGLAGLLSTSMNVQANAIGVGGIPGFLAINSKSMMAFLICMAVALAVPFILTIAFRKGNILTKAEDDKLAAQASLAKAAPARSAESSTSGQVTTVVSPLTGEVKPLSEAVDPVFAQGVMGQGVLVQPSEGELVAPVAGTVSVLFPSKHAVGLVTGSTASERGFTSPVSGLTTVVT